MLYLHSTIRLLRCTQCEKHSKKEEALQKLRDGVKFDEVARDFSEDKARQGTNANWFPQSIRISSKVKYRRLSWLEDPWLASW
jgi:hypothetical protein